jgi:hypothetical protein
LLIIFGFEKVKRNLEKIDLSWLHCPSYKPKEPTSETLIEVSSDDDGNVIHEVTSSGQSNGMILTKNFRLVVVVVSHTYLVSCWQKESKSNETFVPSQNVIFEININESISNLTENKRNLKSKIPITKVPKQIHLINKTPFKDTHKIYSPCIKS